MSTWKKCQVIKKLSGQQHALKDLLSVSGVPSSTYHYNKTLPAKTPTRPELWSAVAKIFSRTNNGCGHRQIAMCLRGEQGITIADKTVLKIMHEMGISCGIRKERNYHRYNSYKGIVGKTFNNILGRDFSACKPFEKMGTDVTEFKQPWGKAYLAPVYDFGSKEITAWSISQHPNLAQQDEMLDMLFSKMPPQACPILTSDMGWQYQHKHYCKRLKDRNIIQSMSRKGNCLDNACTEGLFGHIKDEFYRKRTWPNFDTFKTDLENYIIYWNTMRRQKAIDGMTPEEFKKQYITGVA